MKVKQNPSYHTNGEAVVDEDAPFWSLPAEDILAQQDVDPALGLSSVESKQRLQVHGPNELRRKKKRSSEKSCPPITTFHRIAKTPMSTNAAAAVYIAPRTDAGGRTSLVRAIMKRGTRPPRKSCRPKIVQNR